MSQLIQTPRNLTQLKVGHVLFYLAIIPALFYSLNGFLICSSTQRPDSGKYTNEF